MTSNAPFSEQFRLKGLEWADLDAAARLLEEGKTTYLAQRKAALGDMADSKAEKLVKSSPDWADYIKKMVRAKTLANRARIELEFVKMRYWEHSGSDANKRAEMRL
jgi:hypothetical protein